MFPVPVRPRAFGLTRRMRSSCPVPRQPGLSPYRQAGYGDHSRAPTLAPVFLDGAHLYRQPSSSIIDRVSQSRCYRVKQLRTNSVHRPESAGTGPVVFKVARLTGAIDAYSVNASTWTNKCVRCVNCLAFSKSLLTGSPDAACLLYPPKACSSAWLEHAAKKKT